MKILIVKSSSLGDIIHSFDLVVYLKKKFPYSQIDWVVERRFEEICQRHPMIDGVIAFDSKKLRQLKNIKEILTFRKHLRSKTYDLLFDLQGNIKSGLITLQAKAKKKIGFGKKSVAEWPNLLCTNKKFNPPAGQNIREDYLYLAKSFFTDQLEIGPIFIDLKILEGERLLLESLEIDPKSILVAPFSRWPNKQLKRERLVKELTKLEGPLLLVAHSSQERKEAEALQACLGPRAKVLPQLSLPLLQQVMKRVSLVVAVDSVLLHLAGLTSTPSMSFFGPSLAQKYAPKKLNQVVVQGSCPYGQTFEKRCKILRSCESGACMD